MNIRRPATIAIVLALAACGRTGDAPAAAASSDTAVAPVPSTVATTPAIAKGVARKDDEKNDLYEFSYAYPAGAGAIPQVRALLDAQLSDTKAKLAREARAGQADARKSDYPYHAYADQTQWAVVTETPGWLSLSATNYTFSGGAHGMTVSNTLLWDKRAGRRRAPIDLFLSKAAFRDATAKAMCAALDKERIKKRGGELGAPDDEFSKCIDPIDSATIILGSTDRVHFDRIGFLIPPYNAGPYAEGSYEVTLPVTPALLAAVKPEYRGAFASR